MACLIQIPGMPREQIKGCYILPESEFSAYPSSELFYFYHSLNCANKKMDEKEYKPVNIYSAYLLDTMHLWDTNC